ncbi:MAG: glycosyltransferase, partial [Candidatus Bilamarchaeaceae archaeon]
LMEKGYIAEIPPSVLLEPYEREYLLGNYVNGGSIRFHYVRLPENTGGAGGFHEGMKRAYEKGYDWMWLMDDDAEAKEDALEKLLLAIKAHNSLAGGSRVVNENGATIYHHRGVFSKDCSKTSLIIPITESNSNTQFVEFCSFVGFLVNREIIKKSGLPNKMFYMYNDDVEYTFRVSSLFKVIYVRDSVILHKEHYRKLDYKVLFAFLGRRIVLKPHRSLLSVYFAIRNYWIMRFRICQKLGTFIRLLFLLFKNLAIIIVFYPFRKKLVWCFVYMRAAYDAVTGNFDNKKILLFFCNKIRKGNIEE